MRRSGQAGNSAKATQVLVLWFAFVNTQFLLVIVCLFRWRVLFPGTALGDAVVWDREAIATPVGTALLFATTLLIAAGIAVPNIWFRYLNRARSGSFDSAVLPVGPYIVRFAHFEAAGLLGLCFGFLRGNPLLALPFLGAATVALVACYPSGERLKRALMLQ